MKHSIITVLLFVFIFVIGNLSKSYSQCDGAFKVVYQSLNVSSEKKYLETLHTIYSSSSESEYLSKSKSAGSILVPQYGSAEYNANKSKVRKLWEEHKDETSFTLSADEKLTLTSVYTRQEDVKESLDKWLKCIQSYSDKPYLTVEENSEDDVIITFKMRTNDLYGPNDKVEVTGVIASSNLELIQSTIPTNNIVIYSGSYTLKYKRKNTKSATVRVDLAKGNVIPVLIEVIKKEPRYEPKTRTHTMEFRIEANISQNWLYVYNPEGLKQSPITMYPNQGDGDYQIPTVIKTNLNKSNVRIIECSYIPKAGRANLMDNKTKFTVVGDNYNVECTFKTAHKPIAGKISIIYEETKLECVENCN